VGENDDVHECDEDRKLNEIECIPRDKIVLARIDTMLRQSVGFLIDAASLETRLRVKTLLIDHS